jgi:hypothetical protein
MPLQPSGLVKSSVLLCYTSLVAILQYCSHNGRPTLV